MTLQQIGQVFLADLQRACEDITRKLYRVNCIACVSDE